MITADDIAKEFYPLLYSHQRDYLKDQINAAIVAAVQAEREACAKEAHHIVSDYFDLADTRREKLSAKVAAAIRARR